MCTSVVTSVFAPEKGEKMTRCDVVTPSGHSGRFLFLPPRKVYNNGYNGIMLHRSSDRATIRENHSFGNGDAGLALYESMDCNVYDNVFEDNKCVLSLFLPLVPVYYL